MSLKVYVILIFIIYLKITSQTDVDIDGVFDDKHVTDTDFPAELDYSVETSLNPLGPPVSAKLSQLSPLPILTLTAPITDHLEGSLSHPFVKAVVVLRGHGITHGVIHLFQVAGGPTHISGTIVGLTPLYSHGFHFHERPVSGDCESAGEHYNPTQQTHGGPNDPSAHVGDLGNVEADLKGISRVHKIDQKVSLIGKHGVIGRSLVVHRFTDDLGAGLNRESRTSGNSGGRLACGTVRFVKFVKP